MLSLEESARLADPQAILRRAIRPCWLQPRVAPALEHGL
jgi:hypothetical protein